jgi:hydroxymethylpyrimidine/phosphomethylpyrimidine kinase
MSSAPPIALSIAGSDPSGGAGIQADLKTFAALGTYGAAVITALTAQNTREVRAVHVAPAEFVAQQIDACFEDLDVAATKVGMLANDEIVRAVAARLAAHRARNVVIDPVMVSKSGARLLGERGIAALRAELVPLADVLTPNVPEAATLLEVGDVEVLREPEEACRRLLALGARSVVLKAGHAGGDHSDDWFLDAAGLERLDARRTVTHNTHGTGCTFSAAITARLARGESRRVAVEDAKAFVTRAIESSKDWTIGRGHGPLDHMHALESRD